MMNPHSEEAGKATFMTDPMAKSPRDVAELHAHVTISVYDVPRHSEEPPLQRPKYLCLTLVYHPDVMRVGEYFAWSYEVGAEQELARQQPLFQTSTVPARALDLPYISRSVTRIVCHEHEAQLLPESHRVQLQLDGRAAGECESITFEQLRRGVLLVLRQQVAVMLHGVDEQPQAQREPLLGQSYSGYQLQSQARRLRNLAMPVLITGGSRPRAGSGCPGAGDGSAGARRRADDPQHRPSENRRRLLSEHDGLGGGQCRGAVGWHVRG